LGRLPPEKTRVSRLASRVSSSEIFFEIVSRVNGASAAQSALVCPRISARASPVGGMWGSGRIMLHWAVRGRRRVNVIPAGCFAHI
jgi:hypothetical protein